MMVAGDAGGTKTRLALFDGGVLRFEQRLDSAAFGAFDAVLARFLAAARAALGADFGVERACIGVAGPVADERVQVTNLPWEIDARALEREFGIERVALVNDFVANAYGIDALDAADLLTLQVGEPTADAPRVLIGAGTGLGVAYVVLQGGEPRVVPSEGGHAGFAPADEEQAALWRVLHARLGRVEVEHVVSGAGLVRIYEHLREVARHPASAALERGLAEGDPAAAITRHALEHGDPLANAALDLFIACYGAVAGDHALGVVARGGVYLAGGIAPKIRSRLAAGGFLAAFNAKGAFSDLARSMPVHVVLDERLGLLGAARLADRSPPAQALVSSNHPRGGPVVGV
jgi:glucokinase